MAGAKNILMIGLTRASGGRLAEMCDNAIKIPSDRVAETQEMHLPIYHHICASVEADFLFNQNW